MIRGAALALVTALLAGSAATAATSLTITSSIADGQTLTGKLRWTATPSTNDLAKVDFFVDGVLRSTERHAPYVYGGDEGMLDTTALANGTHIFTVTAIAADGTKTSASATAITRNPPVNTRRPSISGTLRDGSTLSASRGRWTGPGPISYAYTWVRCDAAGGNCAAIAGATGSSYRLSVADVGHRLRVVVQASNSAAAVPASSDPTSVVAARGNAPASTRAP
jgi:hypothetical protein